MIRRFLESIRWTDARVILREAKLLRRSILPLLAVFYVLTILTALFDGTGFIVLINLMTGKIDDQDADPITKGAVWVIRQSGREPEPMAMLLLIVAIFLVRGALVFGAQALDAWLNARIRRQLQETGFAALMHGDWEHLRDIRVGQRVGAITEEAVVVTKYFMSILRSACAVVTGVVLMSIAVLVSVQLTAVMLASAVPAILLLQYLFSRVARLSQAQVMERQGFAADITERLAGLFHVKVEGQSARHAQDGIRHQSAYTVLEKKIGVAQASITAFNVVLPSFVLLVFALWFALRGESLAASLNLLASVGIVGARAAQQFNSAEATLGNLSRLSGSLAPVAALFSVPAERLRTPIAEALAGVELREASYRYPGGGGGVGEVTLAAALGRPLLIRGPSGAGKTTLANLIAGVYRPQTGQVTYRGQSGAAYAAWQYCPVIGYVTQDIHFFHGTIRENLARDSERDDWLWECLGRAGADGVVRELGGLDSAISEAGRSLSGGERRRLGIARMLIRRPTLLILDEVTAGLDEANRRGIVHTIDRLSSDLVVIVVSHDPVDLRAVEVCDLGHVRSSGLHPVS